MQESGAAELINSLVSEDLESDSAYLADTFIQQGTQRATSAEGFFAKLIKVRSFILEILV